MNSATATSKAPAGQVTTARLRVIGALYGLAVVFMFSGFTLVSRLGFASSMKPQDIALLRFAVGGLVMLPILLRHGMAQVRWRDAAALAFCGGLGFALLAYTGFSLAPSSHGAVLLHGTLPLFTFVLAWLTTAASLSRRRALGLAAILLGVVAMAWDSLATSTTRQLYGDAALLLASIVWSAYGLLARRFGLSPAHSGSIVAVLSMVCYVPLYAAFGGNGLLAVPWKDIVLQGLFQGALIGAFSIFIYNRAGAILGAQDTVLFAAAVPSVTSIAAIFLLDEIPTVLALIGIAATTLGVVISIVRQDGAKPP